MKTYVVKKLSTIFIVALFIGHISLNAQIDASTTTISGMVTDKDSGKQLANVYIRVPDTNVGTVTNADGMFTIKIKDSLQAKELEFVHIGYSNYRTPIKGNLSDANILLTANAIVLSEATIFSGDARQLVENAISKIGNNYSNDANLLTGFYRETIQKRRTYISVSEAVIDIYKRPYSEAGIDRDRVQINKGRKLLSQKAGDTLAIKLQGGPNLSINLDVVKNPDLILNLETLFEYQFKMDGNVMLDEREHYIIKFAPQIVSLYPLYYGKLYIDKESLSFSRAEFNLSMDDANKATQIILHKKPVGLRFKPEEVSFLVSYKQQNGKSYLNYVQNNVRFKCDWKRKLFATNYTIVSEMVVINGTKENVLSIPYRQSFRPNQTFSDKVSDFLDHDYWKEYNIIEPTESLESAVNKLRKQYTK